jgi:hypothetical protein
MQGSLKLWRPLLQQTQHQVVQQALMVDLQQAGFTRPLALQLCKTAFSISAQVLE